MYGPQDDYQSSFSQQYYAQQQYAQQQYAQQQAQAQAQAQQHYPQQQYSQQAYSQEPNAFEARVSRTARSQSGVLRQATVSSQFPGETQNPYGYSQPQSVYDEAQSYVPFATEPEDMSGVPPMSGPSRARGISLADNGPVPGPGGVRRVSRQTGKRTSSQAPPQNRYSRSSPSPYASLPPGAAPPQSGFGY